MWDGGQWRDFTYVDDAVEALLLAAASDAANGEVYNLGGAQPLTLRQMADFVVEANGGGSYAVRAFPAERKRIDIGDYYADDHKIRAALGWTPRVAEREGLTRTLAFYRAHLSEYL